MKRKITIEIFEVLKPDIIRERAFRQNVRCLGYGRLYIQQEGKYSSNL